MRRRNIDRYSADSLSHYRPTIDRLSTDYRPTIDRLSTDCRPTINRLSTAISTATSTDISVDITHSKQDPGYVPGLNFKTCCFTFEEEAISLPVFYYCIFAFLSRCTSFNPSMCRLSPFLLHCCCSKVMSLVRIYPNGAPALTGPSPGTTKTDRIIKTSNHFIESIKLHVDLEVGNVEYIVSFFVILAAAS